MKWVSGVIGSALMAIVLTGCCWCGSELSKAVPSDKVALRNIYTDNMVFQREVPIRVCGTGEAGKKITVSLNGAETTVLVAADGSWQAELPAMKAGGPYELKVVGKNTVVLKNVMVGEVWVCSGQSNMEFRVGASDNSKVEIAMAKYPNIRLFHVKKATSPFQRLALVTGKWEVCTPDSVAYFSAVGYFFGRKLHQDLKVPVGLIDSSWGGTRIEPWISLQGFESSPEFKMYIDEVAAGKVAAEAKAKQQKPVKVEDPLVKWKSGIDAFYNKEIVAAKDWKNLDYSDANWKTIELPGAMETVVGDIDGMVWFRRTVEIPAELAGKDMTLSLGRIDDCDITYFNGVKVGETGIEVKEHWSVNRTYQIPGKLVQSGKNVIAVRVFDHYSEGGIFGPESKMFLKSGSNIITLSGKWLCKTEFAMDYKKVARRPNVSASPSNQQFPTTLFNAMINPVTYLPVRGAIWYQGESNAGAPVFYRNLMELLIKNWRNEWHNPNMPVLITQLSAFYKHQPKQPLADDFFSNWNPNDTGSWPLLRESQVKATAIGNAGVAVTIDVGNPIDIHPTNKQDVGKRLALIAEKITYGMNVCASGPTYTGMKIDGNRIILSFDNICGGLVAKGGKLKSFAIAGSDKKFYWANAVISGDKIIVSSPDIKNPVAVRYAWTMYPEGCNFYNQAGLPASPFRTDDWTK